MLCDVCGGEGSLVRRSARQVGYTFGPDESLDSLEEVIVPCPCCPGHVFRIGTLNVGDILEWVEGLITNRPNGSV